MGKSQTETCRIGRAIEKLIRQGRGLNFSCKDRTFEVNKLLIIWLFALVIGPWTLREIIVWLCLTRPGSHQIHEFD